MRIVSLIAAGAALAATPALAAKPVKTAAKPAVAAPAGAAKAPAEVQDAMLYLKVLISALQSDKVEQPVKGALVGCLYNNSLGKITESMDKLIAENPGKVSREEPNQVLSALAAVCGYRPAGAPGATAPAGPAATPSKAPAGR
ncbi:hypothetical protein [Novosphingobium sp. 9U]|uniref:hypothetical protein n=1 Tax=Novosphingobium sp. 9U TaxID=2653158 RepID=UPI0012F09ABD|nr:hypothetical protein [Novosphingobium sp. 9U]VWX51677.1 conserved exported hypothetical protein [Novosphingobium sp. 9U]